MVNVEPRAIRDTQVSRAKVPAPAQVAPKNSTENSNKLINFSPESSRSLTRKLRPSNGGINPMTVTVYGNAEHRGTLFAVRGSRDKYLNI